MLPQLCRGPPGLLSSRVLQLPPTIYTITLYTPQHQKISWEVFAKKSADIFIYRISFITISTLTSGSKGMTTTGTSTSRSYAGDSDMVKSSGNGTALLDASLANDVAEVNKFVIHVFYNIKKGSSFITSKSSSKNLSCFCCLKTN